MIISQNQEPPAGWPRYPKFNEPGDVPGPPVQFGPPVTNANARAGFNFIPNGVEEKNIYYYHPDHLGSSSYITDKNGEVIQHTEYMAFGEVLVDEHSTTNKMPYLFNGKELDYETGLYYYGARYYDPKTSLWLNTDPLSGYNPILETEHYIDGQHNGGVFNPMNMATYSYTYQNPIRYIDPNGKQTDFNEVDMGFAIQSFTWGWIGDARAGALNITSRLLGKEDRFVGDGFFGYYKVPKNQSQSLEEDVINATLGIVTSRTGIKSGQVVAAVKTGKGLLREFTQALKNTKNLVKEVSKNGNEIIINTNSNTFADAKKIAQELTGVGDDAMNYVTRVKGSPLNGKVTGKQNGANYWRLDIDKATGGAHINYSIGKGNKGRINFGGGEQNVKRIIDNVYNK